MPPLLTDDAFQVLQQLVREVAFRANRLLEWRDFNLKARVFETTFESFWRDVKTAAGNFDQQTVNNLQGLWDRCKFPDFTELQIYPESIQHINKPLLATNNGATDDRVQKWIDTLAQSCGQIDADFAGQNYGSLVTNCEALRKLLQSQVSRRTAILEAELKQLCQLSNGLAQRLEV